MILQTLFSVYYLCLRTLLKLVFRNQIDGVWARNSCASKDLTWRSDLDLTLLFHADLSTEGRLAARLRFWQGWAHGEWNVYSTASAALVSRAINPFELQRDPGLQLWLKEQNQALPQPNPIDAAVFLMKQLFVDWKNLQYRPRARRKKWSRHFSQVGKTLNPSGETASQIQSLITELLSLAPEEAQALWKSCREFKAENHLQDPPELTPFWQNHPWLWCFEIARFPFGTPLRPWTDLQKQILFSEIRWEIFAALTQDWRFGGFEAHLARLSDFAAANFAGSDPRLQALQADLQSARRCLKHH
jgi:hypothetical protein